LRSIIDLSATGCLEGKPCINPILGPTQSDLYWSASFYEDTEDIVWGLHFEWDTEVMLDRASAFYVRAVRGGS